MAVKQTRLNEAASRICTLQWLRASMGCNCFLRGAERGKVMELQAKEPLAGRTARESEG